MHTSIRNKKLLTRETIAYLDDKIYTIFFSYYQAWEYSGDEMNPVYQLLESEIEIFLNDEPADDMIASHNDQILRAIWSKIDPNHESLPEQEICTEP